MLPKFRMFGYETKREDEKIKTLIQVSLCFQDVGEIRNFSDFVRRCADELEDDADWNHEHYFGSDGDEQSIVVSLLEKNGT